MTTISACGKYRYTLTRGLPGKTVCFVMLNPSTADASNDDPTIRRCIGFMRAWGFSRLVVVNIYAFRATDPRGLLTATDPVGGWNEGAWRWALPLSETVVCAWGTKAKATDVLRFQSVAASLGVPLFCLAKTKDGHPKHPLYLKGDLKPVPLVSS